MSLQARTLGESISEDNNIQQCWNVLDNILLTETLEKQFSLGKVVLGY